MMPDTFDLRTDSAWQCGVILRCITDAKTNGLIPEIPLPEEGQPHMVSLVINGVEVSFKPFVDMMETSYNEDIKEKALELIKDKYSSKMETLSELLNKIQYDLINIVDNIGIE